MVLRSRKERRAASAYSGRVENPRPPLLHIVEDDIAVRDALGLVLGGDGYRVFAWEDGERFLQEADVKDGDVLLLDLELPGISGAEVASRLTAQRKGVRIIVISGTRGKAFDSAVTAIAPVAALRKPLLPVILSDTVRQLLGSGP